MRLAVVSTILNYPWGGADTLWTRAAEEAGRRGDELLLALSAHARPHPRVAALVHGGAHVFLQAARPALPSLAQRVRRKLGRTVPPDHALVQALGRFRPDRVLVSQGGTYDLLGYRTLVSWLRHEGIPYRIIANWQAEHPELDDDSLAWIRETFLAAERLFFVSQRNLAVTCRHLLLAPLPRAEVIHNPLRWEPADATPFPAGEPVRLATVSRLEENKGVQLLLHALADASRELPAWQLDIFGTGPAERRWRAIAHARGLESRVRFRGHVDALREIWSDRQMLCSPAHEDGVPMTIPEAMLCGRPVLATCVGGAEDWLEDGRTGFLCPAPTVPLLAATLRSALARRADWTAMGHAAAAAAAAHYRPDDFLKLLA